MSDDVLGFETRAIHAGQPADPSTGAVVVPITLATTFAQREVGGAAPYEYARSDNPTRAALEACVASLEGAAHGFAFASGLAAEDAVLRSQLRPGDHLLLGDDAYGGTFRLISRVLAPTGVTWTAVDLTDPEVVARAWTPSTRLVWVESPTNPLLNVVDVAAVAEAAHQHGGICVVDNTFATPYLQTPLTLGADVVVHSTTKYLGGHSDVVGGFVAVNDPYLAEVIGFLQNATGAVPSAFDCYLVLRGIKTLPVRMDRHCKNAGLVAQFLAGHTRVAAVYYPGADDHPGHAIATRQMRHGGGMVSFVAAGGADAARRIAGRTTVFTLAESLGAVESLIEVPAVMTHQSVAGSPLEVDAALVRLSVGLETVEDLLEDLARALD
jgi:cystathionine gamma-synthase